MMVREAKESDLRLLLDLYKQLFPDEDYTDASSFVDVWMEMLNDTKMKCILAFEGTRAAASCILTIIPNLTRNRRPYAVIENVITMQDCRSRGYGRAVMEAAVDIARARQCYKVMLLSGAQRKGAHAFYERLGFDGNSKIGFQMRIP